MGSALLGAAARRLVDAGHDNAFLWVFEYTGAIALYRKLGAQVEARAPKQFFGHDVPSVRMAWPDLAVLIEAGSASREHGR